MSHTFKSINKYNDKTLKDYFIEQAEEVEIKTLKDQIAKLQELKAPNLIIDNYAKKLAKIRIKLNNKTYKPSLTYQDNLTPNILDTKIFSFIEEYNRNDKLVAIIVNENIFINYNTRYCPIISRIKE